MRPEGPSRPEEFQLFFDVVQPGVWKTHLQVSPGQSQNIGVAIRVDPFLIDTDNDGVMEQHQFERRPLLVKLLPAVGRPIQLLGLHLKSKGIFEACEWSKWWDEADANRKKIIAQAAHVRGTFVEPFLTADATKSTPLLVCGDINDGPGMDASEKKLFGSGIERLMGSVWQPGLCLSNAL